MESHLFVFEEERVGVTISVGLAQLQEGVDALGFFKQADECLYAAKRGGRNRVCS